MSFQIITDVEKGISALVDAEYGRALGPIALGDKAIEVLDKFATSHGVDPATIPVAELESRWKDFYEALSVEVGTIDGKEVKASDVVADQPGTAHAGAEPGAAADPQPAAGSETPAGASPAASGAEQGAPSATAEPNAGGEKVMPVTSAKAGNAICPTCDGWGEVTEGGAVGTCPTCKGAGEVPAHLDPEAAKAGE